MPDRRLSRRRIRRGGSVVGWVKPQATAAMIYAWVTANHQRGSGPRQIPLKGPALTQPFVPRWQSPEPKLAIPPERRPVAASRPPILSISSNSRDGSRFGLRSVCRLPVHFSVRARRMPARARLQGTHLHEVTRRSRAVGNLSPVRIFRPPCRKFGKRPQQVRGVLGKQRVRSAWYPGRA